MKEEINSYFGEGIRMRGVLRFKGALRFDGHFQGEIETGDTLIVGSSGKLEAKIDTGSLFNMGQITGNVTAIKKVSIFAESLLTGNIDTPIFFAEEGALFKGNCTMPSTPAKNAKSSRDISAASPALAKDYKDYLPQAENIAGVPLAAMGGKSKKKRGSWATTMILIMILIGAPLGYFLWLSVNNIGDLPIQRTIYEEFAKKQNDAAKLKLLGDTYFRENSFSKSAEVYGLVRELLPNDISILNNLSVAAEKTGKIKEAIWYYEKSLRADPGNKKLVKKLDDYYSAENDTAKRIELHEYVAQNRPNDNDTAELLYTLYKDNNFTEKALDIYRAKMVSSPATIENLLTIGRMEKKLDSLNDAIKTFSEAVELEGDNLEARLELAYAYHKAGYEGNAVEEFLAVGRINKDNIEVVNNNGFAQLTRGNTEKAVELFNTALTISPGNLRSYLGLSTTYSRIGDWNKAEYYSKRILEIDPNYSPALNRLAWSYARMGQNLDDAARFSLESMKYNKDLPGYIDTLSEIYYLGKYYDRAIELINRAISLSPKNKYFKSQLNKFKLAKKRAASRG